VDQKHVSIRRTPRTVNSQLSGTLERRDARHDRRHPRGTLGVAARGLMRKRGLIVEDVSRCFDSRAALGLTQDTLSLGAYDERGVQSDESARSLLKKASTTHHSRHAAAASLTHPRRSGVAL
jgi:hypothetical protein